MSTFVMAFVLGAGFAALCYWSIRRLTGSRSGSRLSGDHGVSLADISRLHSSDEAVRAALVRMQTNLGIDRIMYLSRRGDHFRIEQRTDIGQPGKAISVPFDPKWDETLTRSYGVTALAELFAGGAGGEARSVFGTELNYCFPLFWGGHVYGLLLMGLDKVHQTPQIIAALGSLSQTLSAVSHVESMRQAHSGSVHRVVSSADRHDVHEAKPTRQVLKLVRHRNSETVVRRLIGTAQSEIGLERFVCIYEPKDHSDGLQLVAGGIHHPLHIPHRAAFGSLLSRVESETDTLAEIHAPAVGGPTDELTRELARSGLKHAVAFPLSPHRRGLIAWVDSKPAEEVARRLLFFNDAAAELVANAESFERVEELSHTDPLTGLYNQRYFQSRLAEEINRARRYRRALGLVMIDVDLLKGINDRYGHQAGDAILCQMGKLFRQSVRNNDIIARYGGDEFCVVMPEADLSTCELFMTRMRTWLATTRFVLPGEAKQVNCTISLGAAVFPGHGESAEKLIFAADMALLRAKEAGRNTAQVFDRS